MALVHIEVLTSQVRITPTHTVEYCTLIQESSTSSIAHLTPHNTTFRYSVQSNDNVEDFIELHILSYQKFMSD